MQINSDPYEMGGGTFFLTNLNKNLQLCVGGLSLVKVRAVDPDPHSFYLLNPVQEGKFFK